MTGYLEALGWFLLGAGSAFFLIFLGIHDSAVMYTDPSNHIEYLCVPSN